jgi:hypothetical protein
VGLGFKQLAIERSLESLAMDRQTTDTWLIIHTEEKTRQKEERQRDKETEPNLAGLSRASNRIQQQQQQQHHHHHQQQQQQVS